MVKQSTLCYSLKLFSIELCFLKINSFVLGKNTGPYKKQHFFMITSNQRKNHCHTRLIFIFYSSCMKHCTLFRCCQNQVPRSKHHVSNPMCFLLRHIFLHIKFHICSTRSPRFVLEIYFTMGFEGLWQRDAELLTGV